MAFKIERVTEGCILGEAPHWDVNTQNLYFVDILGQNLLKYHPATKKLAKASVAPNSPSFIIPIDGKKNQFIISLDNQLVTILWDGESDKLTVMEKLITVDDILKTNNNKFNDGKCDVMGRLWAGTQSLAEDFQKTEPLGSLFTFNGYRELKKKVDGVKLSNGIAFNEEKKKFFYIDSLEYRIDQFDYDAYTGSISNRKAYFTFSKHNITGWPDGMTIDEDRNLWVAVFGGKRILKIDGKTPETLLEILEMPAIQVTSLAFGGANLDELYATTAKVDQPGEKLNSPIHGATYKITAPGLKGFPAPAFKLYH